MLPDLTVHRLCWLQPALQPSFLSGTIPQAQRTRLCYCHLRDCVKDLDHLADTSGSGCVYANTVNIPVLSLVTFLFSFTCNIQGYFCYSAIISRHVWHVAVIFPSARHFPLPLQSLRRIEIVRSSPLAGLFLCIHTGDHFPCLGFYQRSCEASTLLL